MTVRTWGRLGVITLAVVLVQVCVLNQIVIGGAHPDAFLLLAISAGLVAGPQRGAVMGFVLGLVADVFVPTPYGLSSLCYVLVAFAVGLAAGTATTRPSIGFQAATALLGGVGGTLLFAGLGTLIGQPSVPHHQLVVIAVVVAAGCVLLANPAFRLLEWTLAVAPGAHRDAGGFASGSAR
ncbi:MAG: rod shape-determining protein MreD [Acidimicrobiales bacterium]